MLFARAALIAALVACPLCTSADARGDERQTEVRPSFGGYLAGRVARGQHDTEAAAHFFKRALSRDPTNEILLEQSLIMDLTEGQIAESVDLAQRLLAAHPTHRVAGLVLGVDAAKRSDFVNASDKFKRAAVSLVGEVTSTLAGAWTRYAEGDVDGALAQLDGLKQADWAQYYLRFHKALISDLAGRNQEAGRLYERAFRSEQRLVRLTLAYAQHAAARGDRKLARSIIAEHTRRTTGNVHPYITALSESLDRNDKVPLLVTNPSEGLAEVFFGLGEALSSEGGIGFGTVYLQLALHLEPSSPFALAALASVYETTKRYESAIRTYERIPEGTPIQNSIRVRKALLLNQLDRLDESRALLERMADEDETDIRALDALGNIMRSRKRYDEAITYYDRVMDRIGTPQKQHWALFFARGTAYERSKNWPKAESDLQRALKLSPDQPSVLNYLGYSWVDQNKNLKQGMEHIRKAVRLRPDDGHIVDSLGWAHYRLGNYRDAVRYLERAVELMPQDPILNDHLGDAYWRVGRRKEARYQWGQVLTLNPEPEDVDKIRSKLAEGLPARAQARAPKRPNQAARSDVQRKKRTENQVSPSPQLR
ncbi:tetratricopeptide repeat protein [Hyphomicrobium sp. CS1BSMeth3]|uniref:tetratricopeptide repeat protein n=1 Tax=Hyphomicrobium sp. CS1BSMeth3 TaxID=1892844 RepID=UPI0009305575|nr:tetratricopeptide repeat protein [Hyphomicrobium sp. CS1BSMeth3]